jgi:hypothetical protein
MTGQKFNSLALYFFTCLSAITLVKSNYTTRSNELTREQSSTVLSIDDLVEINQILKNESFFQNVTTHHGQEGAERTMVTIRFSFSPTLVRFLVKFDTNLIEISLQNYLEYYHSDVGDNSESMTNSSHGMMNSIDKESVYELTNIFVNGSADFVNSTYCQRSTSVHGSIGCYKQLVPRLINTHALPFVLDSITIPLGHDLNYMICIKLVHSQNKRFYFFTENMCHTWLVSNMCRKNCSQNRITVEHQFAYKPMFIVLMYALCASVLIPIVIVSHFQNQAKVKKLLISKSKRLDMQVKSELERRAVVANEQASAATPLLPKSSETVLQPSLTSTSPPMSLTTTSLNDMRAKSLRSQSSTMIMRSESVEAEHILSDKPWISRLISAESFTLNAETNSNGNSATVSNFASLDRQETPKRSSVWEVKSTVVPQASSIRSVTSDLNKVPSIDEEKLARPNHFYNPAVRQFPSATVTSANKSKLQQTVGPSLKSLDRQRRIFETPV